MQHLQLNPLRIPLSTFVFMIRWLIKPKEEQEYFIIPPPPESAKKLKCGKANIQFKILMNPLAILKEDPKKKNLAIKRFNSKISNLTAKLMNMKKI